MTFPEALAKLDQLAAGEVTPEDIEQLSDELELAGIALRHEMIGVCRAQGYSTLEIEEGIERLDAVVAEMSAEALGRLIKKERLH